MKKVNIKKILFKNSKQRNISQIIFGTDFLSSLSEMHVSVAENDLLYHRTWAFGFRKLVTYKTLECPWLRKIRSGLLWLWETTKPRRPQCKLV